MTAAEAALICAAIALGMSLAAVMFALAVLLANYRPRRRKGI